MPSVGPRRAGTTTRWRAGTGCWSGPRNGCCASARASTPRTCPRTGSRRASRLRPIGNWDGRRQAGLYAAWELVREHVPGGPRDFAERARKRMLDHLKTRNESILAHGFRPVTAEGWSGFRGFIEQDFLPMLREQAAQAEFRMDPPQLPTEAIWDAVGG